MHAQMPGCVLQSSLKRQCTNKCSMSNALGVCQSCHRPLSFLCTSFLHALDNLLCCLAIYYVPTCWPKQHKIAKPENVLPHRFHKSALAKCTTNDQMMQGMEAPSQANCCRMPLWSEPSPTTVGATLLPIARQCRCLYWQSLSNRYVLGVLEHQI